MCIRDRRRSVESWSGLTLEDSLLFENPRVHDLAAAVLALLEPEAPPSALEGAALADLSTDDLVAQLEQELNSPQERTP